MRFAIGLAALATFLAGCIVAVHREVSGTAAAPLPATTPVLVAPTTSATGVGQHTIAVSLPATATSFGTASTGWGSIGGGFVSWTGTQGHLASGALTLTGDKELSGATSPSFPVTAGRRYSASGWVQAGGRPGLVALALRFFDRAGRAITRASAIGQPTVDYPAWGPTLPVVAFAPDGAVRGQVDFVDLISGTRETHFLDDLFVTSTSGVAAPIAGPLHASGTKILDGHGKPIVLRGIAVEGPELTGRRDLSTWLNEIDVAHAWGANFIRLPLSPDKLEPGDCAYQSTYLDDVSALVRRVTSLHMVALLDLHGITLKPCGTLTLAPLPDERAVEFWQTVAPRFMSNPLVAFELYNEPNLVSSRVWRDGGPITFGGVHYAGVGMQELYDTVRHTGATNLVFVSGFDWASALPSTRISRLTNAAWGVHDYNCPSGPPPKFRCIPGPQGVLDASRTVDRFVSVQSTMPVVVTEFGWPQATDGRFNANVIAYVDQRHLAGWNVWAYDGTTFGQFDLVRNTGAVEQPSVSGMVVMTGLMAN